MPDVFNGVYMKMMMMIYVKSMDNFHLQSFAIQAHESDFFSNKLSSLTSF